VLTIYYLVLSAFDRHPLQSIRLHEVAKLRHESTQVHVDVRMPAVVIFDLVETDVKLC
jgi:hypothetical protein